MEQRLTRRHDIERVLADPGFEVPVVPPGDSGLAWLRASVSRFVNGAEHARRRALVEAELGRLDPAVLRREARQTTEAGLTSLGARVEVMSAIARPVPMATLGRALGIADDDLAQAVADASLLGPVYLAGDAGGVDEAVERLRRALDRGGQEETAAAIAVLAQACEATAALIGNAVVLAAEEPGVGGDVDALLVQVLRRRAPLRLMRRLSPADEAVTLDLDAAGNEAAEPPLTFGSGLRPCPGADQAVALAAGVLEALLPAYGCTPEGVRWADLPALRLPERLECQPKQASSD
jgi:hypothetical protein